MVCGSIVANNKTGVKHFNVIYFYVTRNEASSGNNTGQVPLRLKYSPEQMTRPECAQNLES